MILVLVDAELSVGAEVSVAVAGVGVAAVTVSRGDVITRMGVHISAAVFQFGAWRTAAAILRQKMESATAVVKRVKGSVMGRLEPYGSALIGSARDVFNFSGEAGGSDHKRLQAG